MGRLPDSNIGTTCDHWHISQFWSHPEGQVSDLEQVGVLVAYKNKKTAKLQAKLIQIHKYL